MMRLNIPIRTMTETVDDVEKEVRVVSFNASLFALVRSVLEIDCRGKSWPPSSLLTQHHTTFLTPRLP